MKRCLTCDNGAIGDRSDVERHKILRSMLELGLVNCLLSPFRASFRSMNHCCGAFKPASEDVAAARVRWVEKRSVPRET